MPDVVSPLPPALDAPGRAEAARLWVIATSDVPELLDALEALRAELDRG